MTSKFNPGHDSGIEGIAIIGMAGRFPDAKNVAEFWHNIKEGKECISFFDEAELAIKPRHDDCEDNKNFIAAKGILKEVDLFDSRFWGYTPNEAAMIDPQQRIFLECAWEAMEDAGYDAERYNGAVGVFGGCYMDTYLLANLCSDPEFVKKFIESIQVGSLQTELGNDKDYIATRTAFKLNLKGPAINVQSACSTSLVSIVAAFHSLITHQCDMALAGGVTITLPQEKGYYYHEGGMVSIDGHCRPFDKAGSGTVFSNAGAVVLLKRESDAIADNDRIYAVIKGAALNNDGGDKQSFTAPSAQGQAEVISMALAMAGFDARTMGYIEAHGTATPLGDPIEVAGLTQAFRQDTDDKQFCAIGSVKANIGHTDVASGVVGVIKCALSIYEGVLPPLVNYKEANPNIDFSQTPFYPNRELKKWESASGLKRAGVSSFGVGGTNAHVVLQQAPERTLYAELDRLHVIVLSARSKKALKDCANRLMDILHDKSARLADIAYTLQVGRRIFEHKAVFLPKTVDELKGQLEQFISKDEDRSSGYRKNARVDKKTVFMFPGQGSQFPGMSKDLYSTYRIFKEYFDQCCAIIEKQIGVDLRAIIFCNDNAEQLKETRWSQPSIFSIEFALAQLWMSWGVKPDAFIGHSVGEYCAACLAGVFSLEEALQLVIKRGEFMQSMAPGGMLSVRAEEQQVKALIGDKLDIAAVNAPKLCVVSGDAKDLDSLKDQLATHDIPFSFLQTSHGFHSRMMDAAVPPTVALLKSMIIGEAKTPIMSTVTGNWIQPSEINNPEYWGKNLRQTVRFNDGMEKLIQQGYEVFLEVGPGQTLTMLARQCLKKAAKTSAGSVDITDLISVASLPHSDSEDSDEYTIKKAMSVLWLNGRNLNWEIVNENIGQRISLPTYPFERKRHWIEPKRCDQLQAVAPAVERTPANQQPKASVGGQGIMHMGEDYSLQLCKAQIDIISKQIAILKKIH